MQPPGPGCMQSSLEELHANPRQLHPYLRFPPVSSSIQRHVQQQGVPAGAAFAPPSPFLGILPPEMWDRPKRFFTQPLNFLNIAPGTTVPQPFRGSTNYDFVAFYATFKCRAVDNLTDPAVTPFLVDMALEGSVAYNPANQPVDIENLFGTAKQPSVWAVPLIIPAGSGFILSLTNLHNATSFNVRCALSGFQVQRQSL